MSAAKVFRPNGGFAHAPSSARNSPRALIALAKRCQAMAADSQSHRQTSLTCRWSLASTKLRHAFGTRCRGAVRVVSARKSSRSLPSALGSSP